MTFAHVHDIVFVETVHDRLIVTMEDYNGRPIGIG